MDELQLKIYTALCKLDGEEVADLFTNYLGNQVLDEGFKDFLVDEGILDEEDDDDEENDDEDDEEEEEEDDEFEW